MVTIKKRMVEKLSNTYSKHKQCFRSNQSRNSRWRYIKETVRIIKIYSCVVSYSQPMVKRTKLYSHKFKKIRKSTIDNIIIPN